MVFAKKRCEGFVAAHRRIREALSEDGVMQDIDDLVEELLDD